MLDLSRVTCFAIDNTNRIEETIKALHTCKGVANFGEVKLITTPEYVTKYKDELSSDGILVEEQVRPLTNIDEYNYYILYHLHKHIDTEYVLLIQDHAFILNPDAWMDEFFDYDYVGAPWTSVPPYARAVDCPTGKCVGNGGFSLRSRALMQEVSTYGYNPYDMKYVEDVNNKGNNEDVYVCREVRDTLEAKGFKFAPTELASFFSVENSIYTAQFGFHGPQTLILNKKFGLFKFRDHAYEKDYLD